MKKHSWLFFILPLLLSSCLRLSTPSITYQSVSFKPLSFQEIQASAQFEISNPNLIPLKGVIDYAVKLNNQELFSGTSSEIEVNSQQSSVFTLDTTLNLPKAAGNLKDLISQISQGQSALPYEIAGTYRTTIAGINLEAPLKANGTLPLPKLPKISLQNISIVKFDLRKPTLKIAARITNTNEIPLKLAAINYDLSSSGTPLLSSQLNQALNVPAGGTQDVEWNITLDTSKVDLALVQKILNNSASFDLQNTFDSIN